MAGNDIVPFTANITQFDDVVLPSSVVNIKFNQRKTNYNYDGNYRYNAN